MKKTLYINGKFFVGESEFADSLFCSGEIIKDLGATAEMKKYEEKADEIVDLEERYVFPDFTGFIRNVEYDFSENGEDLLHAYDKKMANKVLADDVNECLQIGDVADFAVYDVDIIKATTYNKIYEARKLIVKGEVFYDEEEYAKEQWYWLLASQQY